MRIVHINTYDKGGAAKACIELHRTQLRQGLNSWILVLRKSRATNDMRIVDLKSCLSHPIIYYWLIIKSKINYWTNRLRIVVSGHFNDGNFNFYRSSYRIHKLELVRNADIIHLHWVANFLDWPTFFSKLKGKSIIWTLHDQHPFSGGYHYLPISVLSLRGVVLRNLNIIRNAIINTTLTVISPSYWIHEIAKNSRSLRSHNHVIIGNCINTSIFNGLEQEKNGITFPPQSRLRLLFVAHFVNDKRKGLNYLLKVLDREDVGDFHLTIVGEGLVSPQNSYIEHLGYVSDDYELAKIYRSSHLLVAPSLDDNLPSTLLESLCCGTPVVAFDVGGISEIIRHNENGRLSRVGNIEELTNSINWIKQNMRIFDRIRICTEASKLFSADIQSNKILKVYQGHQKIKPRKTLR